MHVPDASPEAGMACAVAMEAAVARILAASLMPDPTGRRTAIAATLDWVETQAAVYEVEDPWVYDRWRFAFVGVVSEMMHNDAQEILTPQQREDTFFSLEAHNNLTGEPVDLVEVAQHKPSEEGSAVAFQMATCALNGQLDTVLSLWGALMDRPRDDDWIERTGYALLLLGYLSARVRLKLMYRQGVLPPELAQALEVVMEQEPFGDLGL